MENCTQNDGGVRRLSCELVSDPSLGGRNSPSCTSASCSQCASSGRASRPHSGPSAVSHRPPTVGKVVVSSAPLSSRYGTSAWQQRLSSRPDCGAGGHCPALPDSKCPNRARVTRGHAPRYRYVPGADIIMETPAVQNLSSVATGLSLAGLAISCFKVRASRGGQEALALFH